MSVAHSLWGWIFVLAPVLLAVPSQALAKVDEGQRALELSTVRDRKKRVLSLKSHRGKVVVLTFGASWCAPCRRELPALDKLSRRYSKSKVVFIAVNIDSSTAKGQQFMRELGITHMLVGFDPDKGTTAAYDPAAMPTTYIIGKGGLVRHIHRGYRAGDERKLARRIAQYQK